MPVAMPYAVPTLPTKHGRSPHGYTVEFRLEMN